MNHRTVRVRGVGTVATGKLLSGKYVREEVLSIDTGISAITRSCYVLEEPRESIRAGETAAMNIKAVALRDISKGSIIASKNRISTSGRIEATIVIVCSLDPLSLHSRLRQKGNAE